MNHDESIVHRLVATSSVRLYVRASSSPTPGIDTASIFQTGTVSQTVTVNLPTTGAIYYFLVVTSDFHDIPFTLTVLPAGLRCSIGLDSFDPPVQTQHTKLMNPSSLSVV